MKTSRVDLGAWPEGYAAMAQVDQALVAGGADPRLFSVVALRVSQLNGCAYCIDMHSKDARALGESEQRLYALNAWRETPFFTEPERAALDLAEAMTALHAESLNGAVDNARSHFEEQTVAQLVYSVAAANAWNRIAITSGPPVGGYRSPYGRETQAQPSDRRAAAGSPAASSG